MAASSYCVKRKSKIPLTIVTASTAQRKRLKCEHLQVSLPQQQQLTTGEEVSENSTIDTGQDDEAEDLFTTIADKGSVTEEVSSHTKRKQKAAEKWKELLSASVDAIIEDQCLPRGVACYICETQYIAVRCIECGPLHYYCEQCATTLHKHGFYHHCPEIWKVSCTDEEVKCLQIYESSQISGGLLCALGFASTTSTTICTQM